MLYSIYIYFTYLYFFRRTIYILEFDTLISMFADDEDIEIVTDDNNSSVTTEPGMASSLKVKSFLPLIW